MTITVTDLVTSPVVSTGLEQEIAFTFMVPSDTEVEIYYGALRTVVDPSDYVVDRNREIDGSPAEGGSITLAAAAVPAGEDVYVSSKPNLTQEQIFTNTGTRLSLLNESLDRATLRALYLGSINADLAADAGAAAALLVVATKASKGLADVNADAELSLSASASVMRGLVEYVTANTVLTTGNAVVWTSVLTADDVLDSTQELTIEGGTILAEAEIAGTYSPTRSVASYLNECGFGDAGWKAVNVFTSSTTFAHAGETEFQALFANRSIGSNANGPANASMAVAFLGYKVDWETSLKNGETDAVYGLGRGSLHGDTGVALNDGRKVFKHEGSDAAYVGDGTTAAFATGFEFPLNSTVKAYIEKEYTGNGATVAFATVTAFTSANHVKAYVNGTEVLRTSYAVTGAGNPAGGTVTFTVAPANLSTVLISVLVDSDDYVVTGAANPAGGTVTFDVAPANLTDIRIVQAYSGGITPGEFTSLAYQLNADQSLSTLHKVQPIAGFMEGFDGEQINAMGFSAEVRVGRGFTAFHAGLFDETVGSEPAPFWRYLFYSENYRPLPPADRESQRNFAIKGNGQAIYIGAEGFRKSIVVDGANVFCIRDSSDSFDVTGPNLFTVTNSGSAAVANLLTVGGYISIDTGWLILDEDYTVAELNGGLGGFPVGSLVVCSNGDSGDPCLAYRTSAGFNRIPIDALIST